MPTLSVIVPVYNVEKYISRCIDSILNQSYADFELLLINDGSTDNSASICNEYEKKDSRIRVFHKENGGVSSARNLGLDNVKGEYITFIDSDDWIEGGYLKEFFIKNINDNTLQIQLYKLYYNDKHKFINTFKGIEYSLSMKDNIENFNILSFTGICGKLYLTTIIKANNIIFDTNISLGEDGLFFYNYLYYVDSIYVINSYSYIYRTNIKGSLNSKEHELQNVLYYLNKKIKYLTFISSKFNLSIDYFSSKIIYGIVCELFLAIFYNKIRKIDLKCLYQKIEVEDVILSIVKKLKCKSLKSCIMKYILLLKLKKIKHHSNITI